MSAIATAQIRSLSGEPVKDATLSGINLAILVNGLILVGVALLVALFLRNRRTTARH